LAAGKMQQIYLSRAAFGLFLQDHRQFPVGIFRFKIAALGSLKRVNERIFKINKSFQRRQARTLTLIFATTSQQTIAETFTACTDSTYLISYDFKQNINLLTQPL